MSNMIPRKKIEELAALVAQERALHKRKAATQAEMIRACVAAMQMNVDRHGLRGHETYAEQQAQRRKNIEAKQQAPLYLLRLATMLEDEAVDLVPGPATVYVP